MAQDYYTELNTLANSIVDGRCILFLGAGAHAAPAIDRGDPKKLKLYPPQGKALAQLLIEDLYGGAGRAVPDARSHARHLQSALSEVLQKLKPVADETEGDPQTILDTLRETYGALRELSEKAPALSGGDNLFDLSRVTQRLEKKTDRGELKNKLFKHIEQGRQPSELLKMLASMPFRIIITTNFDRLFDQTLRNTPVKPGSSTFKNPKVGSYNADPKFGPPSIKPFVPTPETPYLYKLHGDFDHPGSMVVTDKDYIEFLVKLSRRDHAIPKEIGEIIPSSSILFLGYSLRDQNLRVLLKSIYLGEDGHGMYVGVGPRAHYAVLRTHDPIVLDTFKPAPEIHPLEADLWDFVTELSDEVRKVEALT